MRPNKNEKKNNFFSQFRIESISAIFFCFFCLSLILSGIYTQRMKRYLLYYIPFQYRNYVIVTGNNVFQYHIHFLVLVHRQTLYWFYGREIYCALFKIQKRTVISVLGLFRKIYTFSLHHKKPLFTEMNLSTLYHSSSTLYNTSQYSQTKITKKIERKNWKPRNIHIFCSSFFCIQTTHNPRNPRFEIQTHIGK